MIGAVLGVAVTAVSSQQSGTRERRQLKVAGMAMTQSLIHSMVHEKAMQRLYHMIHVR